MTPGYLHFECRHGLRADALNGAMARLVRDPRPVRKFLDILGLTEIVFRISEATVYAAKGSVIHFYIGDTIIDSKPFGKNSAAFAQHELVLSCLMGENIELSRLEYLFGHKALKPTIAALALKMITQLKSETFVDPIMKGHEALWFLCQLIALLAQLDALDPKYVTASRLVMGHCKQQTLGTTLTLTDERWLHQVVLDLPVVEQEEGGSADILAASFLKSLCGHFGPRGDSTIIEAGMGHGLSGSIEALWCEAFIPESIKECGPSNKARVSRLHEVRGLTKPSMDMTHLASVLYVHGARSMTWHLIHGEKNSMYYAVQFLCSEDDKREVVESFLIKGEASQIFLSPVEQHELNKRLVVVPLGQGNKTITARFYEYIYYENIVRVEPAIEDLDRYVEKTGYSVDVARADLLFAWKKWRGRVASET